MTTVERLTDDSSVNDIVTKTGLALETVDAAVAGMANFDRGRAGQLVRQHDHTVLSRINNGSAARPAPPAPTPAPPPTVRPSVRDLLDEAEATGDKRLVAQAGKVRGLLRDIRERLDEIQASQEARAEVARLEAELAAAKARLRGGKPAAQPSEPVSPASGEPSPAELRAWAAAHGIDCPAFGRIPKHVREAWDEERAA